MSYIRSTSNPEQLWVWEDSSEKKLMFSWKNSNPQENPFETYCSLSDFKTFMRKVFKKDNYLQDNEVIKHKTISIEEVWYSNKTNKIWRKELPRKNKTWRTHNFECLICLTVNGKQILMYDVTWKYLYSQYIEQNDFHIPKKKKKS